MQKNPLKLENRGFKVGGVFLSRLNVKCRFIILILTVFIGAKINIVQANKDKKKFAPVAPKEEQIGIGKPKKQAEEKTPVVKSKKGVVLPPKEEVSVVPVKPKDTKEPGDTQEPKEPKKADPETPKTVVSDPTVTPDVTPAPITTVTPTPVIVTPTPVTVMPTPVTVITTVPETTTPAVQTKTPEKQVEPTEAPIEQEEQPEAPVEKEEAVSEEPFEQPVPVLPTIEPTVEEEPPAEQEEDVIEEEPKEVVEPIEKPKIESIPEPKIEEKVVQEEPLNGFDTVGVSEPEGNWLLKRVWWEKAQKKYEKIKRLVARIIESRMSFFKKRNDIDRNVFDPFYHEVGLSQGQIEEIVSDLIGRIEKEREEDLGLSSKEKEFLDVLFKEKKTLEELKMGVDAIRQLDVAIDDDLTRLMEQLNLSRKYEEMSWQVFKNIAKVLNHKKARELYYKMDTLWKNVKSIEGYVKGAFTGHFDSIIENANRQIEKIKTTANAFKSKGIDLKKQYEKIGLDQEMLEKEASALEPKKEDANTESVGWAGYIYNKVTWPFRSLLKFISSLWG